MWPWSNKREIDELRRELAELKRDGASERDATDLRELRNEIRSLKGAVNQKGDALCEAIRPTKPGVLSLRDLLQTHWRVGFKSLPRWASDFVFAHWQWCLSVMGAALALGVPAYLQWEANLLSQETLRTLSQQVESQAADTKVVRRTQLLTLIYESVRCTLGRERSEWDARRSEAKEASKAFYELKPQCEPKAPLRLREEAALALAMIDGGALDLSDATLSRVDFGNMNLEGSNFSSTNFEGANLSRANLSGATLEGTNFSFADLSRSNLRSADLEGANLFNASLEKADLSRSNLEGGNLKGVDLEDADLRGTNLSRVEGLIQSQLEYAIGDHATRLPEMWDLERPEHWLREGEDSREWLSGRLKEWAEAQWWRYDADEWKERWGL